MRPALPGRCKGIGMIVCARCGTPLEDDMRFCIECGEAVGPAPAQVSATGGGHREAASAADAAAPTASVTGGGLSGPAPGSPAAAVRPPRSGPVSPMGAGAMTAPDASPLLPPGAAVSPQPVLHWPGGAPVALLRSWRRMRWLKTLTVFAVLCVLGASIWFGLKQRPASVRSSETRTAPAPPHTTAVEIPPSTPGSRSDSGDSANGSATELPSGGAENGDQTLEASGVPPAQEPGVPPSAPAPAPALSSQSSAEQRPVAAASAAETGAAGSSAPGANQPGSAGTLVWKGRLRRGAVVSIDGARATTGMLQGALPGVPVVVESASPNVRITEMPGPANGWKRIAFESLRDQNAVVTLHWRLF